MLVTATKSKISFISLPNVDIYKKKSLKDQIKDDLKHAKAYSSTKEIWDDVDNW